MYMKILYGFHSKKKTKQQQKNGMGGIVDVIEGRKKEHRNDRF